MTHTPWPHRTVGIPRVLRVVRGRSAVVGVLHELSPGPGTSYLVVHSGRASGTGYGSALVRDGRRLGLDIQEWIATDNTARHVTAVLGRIAGLKPTYVIGTGGGRIVDVAKMAAFKADVGLIAIPTQASSDGMCSPVAVLRDRSGRSQSLAARIPVGIIADMDILATARPEVWRSGLGDLMSNLSAVRDWRLASSSQGENIDDFACLTSEAAALSVMEAAADLLDPLYQEKLIRGLVLSGIAMEMAGSSRPASGSEHLISHALDLMLERPARHGLQVALGTIAAYLLRGDRVQELVEFFRSVGLPVVPLDLDLDDETLIEAIRRGRSTRPGRWTALDQVGEADLARLLDVYKQGSFAAVDPL